MKIISDLKAGEAVEFEGGFLVNLDSGEYEINGSTVSVNGYGGRQFTVETIDSIFRITKSSPKLTGFTLKAPDGSVTGEPFGTLDEFYILTKANKEGLESGFLSLADEFHIRTEVGKYNACFKVMSEPEVVKTKVELNVIGTMIDTGSDFIHSALHVGEKSFADRGMFKVNLASVALDEFNRIAATLPGLTNATHSNIQYAQYKGSYIFTDYKNMNGIADKSNSSVVYKTLESAKAGERTMRQFVRREINLHSAPADLKDLPDKTIHDLVKLLNHAQTNLYETQSMAKSKGALATGRSKVNEAIEMLKSCVSD